MMTFEDKKTKKNIWGLNLWYEKWAFVIGCAISLIWLFPFLVGVAVGIME